MSIRLSGAQVTRVLEALDRYKRNGSYGRNSFFVPYHQRVEELVEQILTEVIPECPITNTPKIQNAPPNVSASLTN